MIDHLKGDNVSSLQKIQEYEKLFREEDYLLMRLKQLESLVERLERELENNDGELKAKLKEYTRELEEIKARLREKLEELV